MMFFKYLKITHAIFILTSISIMIGVSGTSHAQQLSTAAPSFATDSDCLDSSGLPARFYLDSQGSKIPCDKFESQSFVGAKLSKVDRAIFKGAEINWTELRLAQMKGMDLTGVTITNSIMYGANLSGATLSGKISTTTLGAACFCGTDLTQAQFTSCTFSSAYYDEQTKFPPSFDTAFLQKWRMVKQPDCEKSCHERVSSKPGDEAESIDLPPTNLTEVLIRKAKRRSPKRLVSVKTKLEIALVLDVSGSMMGHFQDVLKHFDSIEKTWPQAYPDGISVHVIEVGRSNPNPVFGLQQGSLSDFKSYLSKFAHFTDSGWAEYDLDGAQKALDYLRTPNLTPEEIKKTQIDVIVITDETGDITPSTPTRPVIERLAVSKGARFDWVDLSNIGTAKIPACPNLLESGLDELEALGKIEQLIKESKCKNEVDLWIASKTPGLKVPASGDPDLTFKLFRMGAFKALNFQEEYRNEVTHLLLLAPIRYIPLTELLSRTFTPPSDNPELSDAEAQRLLIEILVYLEPKEAIQVIEELGLVRSTRQLVAWLDRDDIEPEVKEGIIRLIAIWGTVGTDEKSEKSGSKKGTSKKISEDDKIIGKILKQLTESQDSTETDATRTQEAAISLVKAWYRKNPARVSSLFLDWAEKQGSPEFALRVIVETKMIEAIRYVFAIEKKAEKSGNQATLIQVIKALTAIAISAPSDITRSEACKVAVNLIFQKETRYAAIDALRKIREASASLEACGKGVASMLSTWADQRSAIDTIRALKLKEALPHLRELSGTKALKTLMSPLSKQAMNARLDLSDPELRAKAWPMLEESDMAPAVRSYLTRELSLSKKSDVAELILNFDLLLKKPTSDAKSPENKADIQWLQSYLRGTQGDDGLPYWRTIATSERFETSDRMEALQMLVTLKDIPTLKKIAENSNSTVASRAKNLLEEIEIRSGRTPTPQTKTSAPVNKAVSATGSNIPSNKNTPASTTLIGTPGIMNAITEKELEKVLEFSQTSDMWIIVKFEAEWCGPCKAMRPEISAIAKKYSQKARVYVLDSDNSPQAASQFRVRNIPHTFIIQAGRVELEWIGFKSFNEMDLDLGARIK